VAGRDICRLSLVYSPRPHIIDCGLPVIHDTSIDNTAISGRDLQYDWTNILGIEEWHEINHVGVWR